MCVRNVYAQNDDEEEEEEERGVRVEGMGSISLHIKWIKIFS